MSIFSRKSGDVGGVVKTPSYDPYSRYSNTGSGVFGFRKDNHVIMPGVTAHEEFKLSNIKKYVEKETGKSCTLSQELINDIYSMYVNGDVKKRPEDNSNVIRHKVLDKVYDSLTKVVTVDSPLYTQILSRELAMVLQMVDDDVNKDQEQNKDSGDKNNPSKGLESQGSNPEQGEGEPDEDGDGSNPTQGGKEAGKGNSSGRSIEDIVDEALDRAKPNIEKAKEKADDKIKSIEDQLGKEAMKDLMNSEPEFLEKIDKLKDTLKNVSINKSSIQKVMEKILNESMNYFSTKFKRVEESLFDCEECEDLFGLEFLHPVFKNAEIMSVGNETRVYKGKIDLYLDCSGSMSYQETFEGTRIRMSDLAKGIAMVLYRMGMIENLYFFDTNLYKIENVNELTILSFSKSGGTNFNKVIDMVNHNGNNAVIITDGEDSCRTYTKGAFWIGIGGTRFTNNYSESAFPMYRGNKQAVAYNGNTSKFEYC